jgi:DNA-binding response OmpR family regulator
LITAGNITINQASRRVYVDDREVELKNKEYETLLFLASNPDIVFSKETLYERIWGMDALGDAATVAVHINRLREKIERDPSEPAHIQTIWGAGYRFRK